jgi:hypothetical protein
MSLSCSCPEWEGEGEFYIPPDDFSIFNRNRSKKCASCKSRIAKDMCCLEIKRFRGPITEIEAKIFGEDGEINLASKFLCESCGEIFLNLEAAGFCVEPTAHMHELLEEYHELSGFKSPEANQPLSA